MLPNPLPEPTNAAEDMFKSLPGGLLGLGGAQVDDPTADVILLSAIKNLGERLLETICPNKSGGALSQEIKLMHLEKIPRLSWRNLW
jgi:hypothetical protein